MQKICVCDGFAGCVTHPFRESLDSTRLSAPDHMKCCLYLSDDGASSKTGGSVGKGGNSQHMVSLAMKNSFDPVGNVKVSVHTEYSIF